MERSAMKRILGTLLVGLAFGFALVPPALAALGVAFWVVHPHAWAYLAALPVPFLAITVARTFERTAKAWRWSALAAAGGALLQAASAAAPPLGHVPRALAGAIAP